MNCCFLLVSFGFVFCCELKAFEKYRSYLKWARDHFWKCSADEKSCLVTCLGKLFSGQDGGILLYIYMCVCIHTLRQEVVHVRKFLSMALRLSSCVWKNVFLSSVANDVSRPLDRHCSCFCRFSLQRRPCVQHLSVAHYCHILTAF